MKEKFILLLLCFCFCTNIMQAQQNTDFLGAGHQKGITVTTSHNQSGTSTGEKTIDGFPVTESLTLKEASRFLAQATMGYDYETIQQVAAMGYEAWLDEQFALPHKSLVDWNEEFIETFGEEPNEEDALYGLYKFRTLWWNKVLSEPDLLRQKINYALSQIFVISGVGSDLFEDVEPLSTVYYSLLGEHAFGNYRDLLSAVSRNLSMGIYLSHFNNPRSDPSRNIHPDENYAREVMQLFSIGLYELNNDGTQKLDSTGNLIPTYDNDDIREFAKIFTGFGDGRPDGEFGRVNDGLFGLAEDIAALPMRMYDEWHEPGTKKLLNGKIVPAGQSGLQDFEDAMDNLANHPNVGPFIGKALIQFLVTSNPSPAYVNRVANAFNSGEGGRGSLKSVIKAILLDPEARDCDAVNHPTGGKLREPMLRYTGFLRAFKAAPKYKFFIDIMQEWQQSTGQAPLYSPSVFNFYLPDFQPNGVIAEQDLVAPVFQIHNSSTSIGFVNEVNKWLFLDYPLLILDDEDTDPALRAILGPIMDYSTETALLDQPEDLVNRLDILLAAGQLSADTKKIIVDAVSKAEGDQNKLDLAIYLIMISPEYAVLK